jgi:glutathione synthase/RimK-type ligase-like ATP-grasp enzyme
MIDTCSLVIRQSKNNTNTLYLPHSIVENLSGPIKPAVTIKLGPIMFDAEVSEIRTENYCTIETTHTAFPETIKLDSILLQYVEYHNLFSFGPFTAMIVLDTSLRSLHAFSKECVAWYKQQGGHFFIIPASSFLKGELEGYFYNEEENKWGLSSIITPDVFYNRIHSRKLEKHSSYKQALNYWKNKGVHIFNEFFLKKSEVYDLLAQENQLKAYLPETRTGLQELSSMVTKHKDIFIKEDQGSQGKKIIRMQQKESHYKIYQNSFHSKSPLTISSLQDANTQINTWCESGSYIIQETIPFCCFKDKQLDFRILCHLNKVHNWMIVSSVARIAADNQFVSNLDRGGEILKPLAVLSHLFSKQSGEKVFSVIKELALETARTLSESSSTVLAEVGIDIGIDKSGKPWIIEVNSKPSKQAYSEIKGVRPSVKALYEYSKNLWIERSTHL